MTDLKTLKDNAVDLSAVAKQRTADQERRQASAMAEAERVAQSWARNMKRSFKGIMTHQVRVHFLMKQAGQS